MAYYVSYEYTWPNMAYNGRIWSIMAKFVKFAIVLSVLLSFRKYVRCSKVWHMINRDKHDLI